MLSSAPLAADGPLDGRIAGRIDLALLPKVIDLYGDAVSGRLDLDLAVGGSLADPRASGRADLTGAAYESASAGTVLRDLTAEIVGDRDRVRLVSLSAAVAAYGGSWNWQWEVAGIAGTSTPSPATSDCQLVNFMCCGTACELPFRYNDQRPGACGPQPSVVASVCCQATQQRLT